MSRLGSVLRVALGICGVLPAPRDTLAQAAGPRQPAASAGHHDLGGKLQVYLSSAATTLDRRPGAVLRLIPDHSRRMLAVAYYLRQRRALDDLWTWSTEEIRAHQKTVHYRQAMTELRRVRRTFAAQNPGYRLVADTNGRSLPAQVASWNRERSVAAAAREFLDSCREWLADDNYPARPDSASLARFLDQVAGYQTVRPPTVAVPGLSLHGRLRAIDFAILSGKGVVAGTSSASVATAWDSSGWTERLKQAVTQANTSFIGPLELPREPWHYEYRTSTEVANKD